MSKILIVEDEPDMVLGLKDNFEFEGYEVLTAADGQGGLERARTQKPDLIILDIMLPKPQVERPRGLQELAGRRL